MKITSSILAVAAMAAFSTAAYAQGIISMNFAQNATGNQTFSGGANIGPLSTNSSNWNTSVNPTTGTLAAGTLGTIIDDSGATVTGASLSWSAPGVWYNSAFNLSTDDQAKLFVGFLDDNGATGPTFTLTGITYAQYNLYVLTAANTGDANGGTTTYANNGYSVNGGTATPFTALGYNGLNWVQASGATAGNYVEYTGLTGASLTASGIAGNGQAPRSIITGFIIQQVPEPSTLVLAGIFGFGMLMLFRRRRA